MVSSQRYFQKLNAHMAAAEAYAGLSYARRLQVGSVIVRDDRIISIGYNGTPTGRLNQCEDEVEKVLITKPEVVHAEANALMYAAKSGVSTNGCTIVTTHSPCFDCSKLIIQSGIELVIYRTNYRDLSPIDLLKSVDITVIKI